MSAPDGPVYSSYVQAWQAEAKAAGAGSPAVPPRSFASTDYGPSGSAARVRQSRHILEGSPLPAKPMSVLHRPVKPPSAKNMENLDAQHMRDQQAFDRRASTYRRLAQNKYHHNAPPGSILTTFEQGHIVDRGRGKSAVHEAKGIYDPVVHTYRVEPAADASRRPERPTSAPHSRGGYAAIHAAQQQAKVEQEPTHHHRPVTPFEHKLLQASRGTYNPLTHEYLASPEPDYVRRKEKEWDRGHGLGHGVRRVVPESPINPITGIHKPVAPPAALAALSPDPRHSTAAAPYSSAFLLAAAAGGDAAALSPGPCSAAPAAGEPATPTQSRPQESTPTHTRPTSAPHSRGRATRVSGQSFGSYNPILHHWNVPPADPKFQEQEAMVEKKLGVTGQSLARNSIPQRQGVYNPILNTWTVPPADPRVADGLSFKPATLFSKPTAATIRM